MFKKTERLGRDQFDTFFKTGKRHHFEHATLVFSPYPTLHVSVVVSKKVHKSAVQRNTLRRRIYAQFRTLKQRNCSGVFIVILKPSFKTLTRLEAKERIAELIERIVKPA